MMTLLPDTERLSVELRFWRAVRIHRVGCWEWNLALNPNGYGKVQIKRAGHVVAIAAHRISYELMIGQIPAGLCVCHHCDNPACVRPDHLFLGTQMDNMKDMQAKGRSSGAVGELNPHAKLNADSVRAIRLRLANGEGRESLAREFGVKNWAIRRIELGRTWRHLVGS